LAKSGRCYRPEFYGIIYTKGNPKKDRTKDDRLLKKPGNYDIKMKVMAAGAKEPETEWSVNVLFNHLEIPSEIIIITKKISYDERRNGFTDA
jgi:hypothetical protein